MKNFRLFILVIANLIVLPAQDFGQALDHFIVIDNAVEKTTTRLNEFNERQSVLQTELDILKVNRTWYNGWINEMLLARKTTLYTSLADSTASLEDRLSRMLPERDQALRNLKEEYTTILHQGDLTATDKERAISLGAWMVGQPKGKIDLPDYIALLEIEYEDEQIRQLVWRDLKVVVDAKLILIDSVLKERRQEQELMARLNEFHHDLSLLQESDRDLGSPTASRSVFEDAEATFGGWEDGVTNALDADVKSTRGLAGITLSEQSDLNNNPEGTARTGTLPANSDTDGEISRLITKRQLYQQILARIEADLSTDN